LLAFEEKCKPIELTIIFHCLNRIYSRKEAEKDSRKEIIEQHISSVRMKQWQRQARIGNFENLPKREEAVGSYEILALPSELKKSPPKYRWRRQMVRPTNEVEVG